MSPEQTKGFPQLLTLAEASTVLRVSRTSIYRLIDNGELLPIRVNRRVLFDANDLLAFIDSRRSTT